MATLFWTTTARIPRRATRTARRDIEGQAQAILKMDPAARFYVRPGEACQGMAGQTPAARCNSAAPASQWIRSRWPRKWAGSISFVTSRTWSPTCEARPWADRIVGYMYFAFGEGLTGLACSGFTFDVCDAMQQAFRQHVGSNTPTKPRCGRLGARPLSRSTRWPCHRGGLEGETRKAAALAAAAEVQRERDYAGCRPCSSGATSAP